MGGCKIASLEDLGHGGNAWPKSPYRGSLTVGDPLGERAVRGGQVFDPLSHLARRFGRAQGELGPLGVGGEFGFRRTERRVVLIGVTAAEFGVGGDG